MSEDAGGEVARVEYRDGTVETVKVEPSSVEGYWELWCADVALGTMRDKEFYEGQAKRLNAIFKSEYERGQRDMMERAAKIQEEFWRGRICSCGNCNAGAYLAEKIRSLKIGDEK